MAAIEETDTDKVRDSNSSFSMHLLTNLLPPLPTHCTAQDVILAKLANMIESHYG